MLAKKVWNGLLCLALAALSSACSTPCGAPGALCAPIETVTRAAPPPARLPERPPAPPVEEPQTFAVPMPGTAPEKPAGMAPASKAVRIGLMLPLRSETLGRAADALRAGFMAAWERDRDGFEVNVIETGDGAQEVLPAYTEALQQNDIIVGPLARSAVTTLAASQTVSKPTIALNHPEGRDELPLPEKMLAIGLSIEDEARQVADLASRDYPGGEALIVSGGNAWQRRAASAFAAQWQRLGLKAKTLELSTPNGYLSDPELVALRSRLAGEPVELLFAALDVDQARQLRVALNAPPLGDIPVYGTSSLNPGRSLLQPGPELDGVRLIDLPWLVQRDHPAVMVYPQPVPRDEARLSADMERLYALGIDAFRIAREIARRPAQQFQLDGVTGQLTIGFGNGPSRFQRVEPTAVYKNGVPLPAGQ
ncbi:penicillin-binding protein activator [Massilia endophytica]|uniref:penicillin-binding protein activator n=1 Tax=Massilia endophytica TaxID=2899220 RepID=UPI001E3F5F23|nr:penicillin-binding protein activator [Massilia endophytica]UGQ46462.1 penicillin-binding protein activator [Massilia endophytica]